jgi:hypothetical protein
MTCVLNKFTRSGRRRTEESPKMGKSAMDRWIDTDIGIDQYYRSILTVSFSFDVIDPLVNEFIYFLSIISTIDQKSLL